MNKAIPEFPGYFATRDGKILSDKRVKLKPLKYSISTDGYMKVSLCRNGKAHYFTIHRLIGLTFLEMTEGKDQVAHKNGNKLDNRAENLYWATSKENYEDRVRHGTSNAGEGNPRALLNQSQVKQIRMLYKIGKKPSEIVNSYCVGLSAIERICYKRSWKHLED